MTALIEIKGFSRCKGSIAMWNLMIIMLVLTCPALHAQSQELKNIEITGFYGWQFGGNFTSYQGEVEMVDAENFGGMIDVPVAQPNTKLELSYSRQSTRVDLLKYPSYIKEELFDISVEYFQIGGVYENPRGKKVVPFGSFTVGAARFAPQVSSYQGYPLDDEWLFSMTLGAGLKAYFNERAGIRLQARMLMPVNFSGGSVWCSSGGCAIGASGGSTILQGDVFGGVFIVF